MWLATLRMTAQAADFSGTSSRSRGEWSKSLSGQRRFRLRLRGITFYPAPQFVGHPVPIIAQREVWPIAGVVTDQTAENRIYRILVRKTLGLPHEPFVTNPANEIIGAHVDQPGGIANSCGAISRGHQYMLAVVAEPRTRYRSIIVSQQ